METATISTLEAKRPRLDTISTEQHMGRLALRAESLGINDPLTHLYQYLETGEASLVGIRADLETDIAERLPKTPFINHVGFKYTGSDFESINDAVSMQSMTKNNLDKIEALAIGNQAMATELARAKIEDQEVTKLAAWFGRAPIGGHLIFESLPIGDQKIAVSRIYQKTNAQQLSGCFVSLYSPSVDQFNQLRTKLSPTVPTGRTEIDMLQACYEFYQPDLVDPDRFIDHYVDSYDQLLDQTTGLKHTFGLDDIGTDTQNGLTKVRNQPKLTASYVDTIKTLAASQGSVTPELIRTTDRLGSKYHLRMGQALSNEIIRGIMREVILSITSVIDQADPKLLAELAQPSSDQSASYEALSYYGEQAKSSGQNYDSNNCPEYAMGNVEAASNNSNTEFKAMQRAFNVPEALDNFGQPSIGVCRTSNCPSHGSSTWWPDKTVVGGCSVCVGCHELYGQGKSPKNVYRDKNAKQERARLAADKAAKLKVTKATAKTDGSLWSFFQ